MPYWKRKNDDLNKCLLIECEIFLLNGKPDGNEYEIEETERRQQQQKIADIDT